MVAKLFALCIIAAAVTQGLAITQIILPDEHYTFMTNQLISKTLTIPKLFLDTLETCHVVFPNGLTYQAYPTNQLPADGHAIFLEAAEPFVSCAIGFIGAPISASGTYELLSLVHHTLDSSRSLTRQRFHLNLFESSS